MSKFAERLKNLRVLHGLSQAKLAEILAVDQRAISSWENSINETDYDMLLKIARYFDVSVDYLLGNED